MFRPVVEPIAGTDFDDLVGDGADWLLRQAGFPPPSRQRLGLHHGLPAQPCRCARSRRLSMIVGYRPAAGQWSAAEVRRLVQ